MKLLGTFLLLAGAMQLRAAALGGARRERRALRDLIAAMEHLRRGVQSLRSPLPELLSCCGLGVYADRFFAQILDGRGQDGDRPLPDCWREAVGALPLGVREKETLVRAADALGGDEEGLLRALDGTAEELRGALHAREAGSAREDRVTTALCLSFGILAAVLLF